MSVLWCDSGETGDPGYNPLFLLPVANWNSASGYYLLAGAGVWGGSCWYKSVATTYNYILTGAPPSQTNIVLFWMKFQTAMDSCFFHFMDSTNSPMVLTTIAADGSLTVRDCNNVLKFTSAAGLVKLNTWQCWQMKVIYGNVGVGRFTLRLDNAQVCDLTSIDTLYSTIYGSRLYFDIPVTDTYIDDIVVADAATGGLNALPTMRHRVWTLMCNSTVSNNFTLSPTGVQAHENLDDPKGALNDLLTTQANSITQGQQYRLGFEQIVEDPAEIWSVILGTCWRAEATPYHYLRRKLWSGGIEYTGTPQSSVANISRKYLDRWSLNPNGSVPWTKSAVNALNAGGECRASAPA